LARGPWFAAVLALAWGQWELWVAGATNLVGPRWAIAASAALASVCLGWRRRAPLTVLVAVLALTVAPMLVWGASQATAGLLPMVISVFAVGRHGPRPAAYLALPLSVGAIVVQLALDPLQSGVAEGWAWSLFGVAFWAAGAWLRQRQELEDRREAERIERTRAAVAEERTHIARELHDMLAHSLGVMVIQAEAAEEMLDRDPQLAQRPMQRVQTTGREALAEIRQLLTVLRGQDPASTAPLPGLDVAEALVDRLREAGLPLVYERTGDAPVPDAVARAVYRVLQEALTNVLRRAGPDPGPAAYRSRRGRPRRRGRRPDERSRPGRRPRPHRHAGTRRSVRRDAARGTPAGWRFLRRSGHPPETRAGRVMIRVVIADDQELVREGLALILDTQDDISVVAQAADGVEAVQAVRDSQPDVVLMDVQMPRMDGIEATRRIVAATPRTRVLVLTTFDLDEYVYAALRVGASGYLLKDAPRTSLLQAVRAVATGDLPLASGVARRLVADVLAHHAPLREPPAALSSLTERERDVLRTLAHGSSNAEIATGLVISEATVKTHVAHLLAKLGLRDRVQLVVFAYEYGLVTPGEESQAGAG